MKVELPLRTVPGLNTREHHFVRARRVRSEKASVGFVLNTHRAERPQLPCEVTMTRIAPSVGLDTDNLVGSMKAVRDAIADWLNVDDKSPLVDWHCEQERGPWGVRIETE